MVDKQHLLNSKQMAQLPKINNNNRYFQKPLVIILIKKIRLKNIQKK